MKKEVIYSMDSGFREEFHVDGFLFSGKGRKNLRASSVLCEEMNISSSISVRC